MQAGGKANRQADEQANQQQGDSTARKQTEQGMEAEDTTGQDEKGCHSTGREMKNDSHKARWPQRRPGNGNRKQFMHIVIV